jgi:hypothetical protein
MVVPTIGRPLAGCRGHSVVCIANRDVARLGLAAFGLKRWHDTLGNPMTRQIEATDRQLRRRTGRSTGWCTSCMA